jgi:thymidine kinase
MGLMFSGKTEKMMKYVKQYQETECILIKHRNDIRSDEKSVISHAGQKMKATTVDKLEELEENDLNYKKLKLIAVDEGHFFHNIAPCAQKWALQGKMVIITTIKSDLFMEPIQNVSHLIAIADKVTILSNVCSNCNAKAVFNYRKTPLPETDNDVERYVGGAEDYTILCRECFSNKQQQDYNSQQGIFSDEKARQHVQKLHNTIK